MYITVCEFKNRAGDYVPKDENGDADETKIEAALTDAASIIHAYMPELLDEEGVELEAPVKLAGVLKSINYDLALYKCLDAVTGGEELLAKKSKDALKLLSDLAGGVTVRVPDEVKSGLIEGASTWIRGPEVEAEA